MFFEIQNLCFSYYKKPLCLKDINLKIEEMQKTIFVATKDMGKTTLLKVFSGFEDSYFGKILLKDNDLKKIADKDKNFSLLLSEPVFFDKKSIKQNLDYFCDINNLDCFSNNQINNFLHNWKISKCASDKIKKLSLFEKRKLAMMRAFLKSPNILFLDDQFENLNNQEKKEMAEIYSNIFDHKNATIISCIGAESYKILFSNAFDIGYDKFFYLCNGIIKNYKNAQEFELLRENFNIVEFLPYYESFPVDVVFENGKYMLVKYSEAIMLDDKYSKRFKKLKLENGEIEECLLLPTTPINKNELSVDDMVKMLEKNEANLYAVLGGEKLI